MRAPSYRTEPMPIDRHNWRTEFANAAALPPAATPQEKAQRGRDFEAILFAMFDEAGLQPRLSYRPTGEEVDGSIWLDGGTILIEAKWTAGAHPASSIYQFKGKVDGKLVGTLGLFISINGFSPDAVDALVAGKELNIILADGGDIRAIARHDVSVTEALRQKLRAAGDEAAVYWPLEATTARSGPSGTTTPPSPPLGSPHTGRRIVVVEGRNDVHYLEIARRALDAAVPVVLVPAGGPMNMPRVIRALSESSDIESITAIVDADVDVAYLEGEILEKAATYRESGARLDVIAAEPDLETVLGLSDAGVSWADRGWLRHPLEGQLEAVLTAANLRARASDNRSLRRILATVSGEQHLA